MKWPDCPAEYVPRKYQKIPHQLAACCTRRRFHPGDHKAGTTTPGECIAQWWRMWEPLPESGGGPWISGTWRGRLLCLGLLACLASVNIVPHLADGTGHPLAVAAYYAWYAASWPAYICGFMRLKADQRRRKASRELPSLTISNSVISPGGLITMRDSKMMKAGQAIMDAVGEELLLKQAGSAFADYMDVHDRQVCIMLHQVIKGQQS